MTTIREMSDGFSPCLDIVSKILSWWAYGEEKKVLPSSNPDKELGNYDILGKTVGHHFKTKIQTHTHDTCMYTSTQIWHAHMHLNTIVIFTPIIKTIRH